MSIIHALCVLGMLEWQVPLLTFPSYMVVRKGRSFVMMTNASEIKTSRITSSFHWSKNKIMIKSKSHSKVISNLTFITQFKKKQLNQWYFLTTKCYRHVRRENPTRPTLFTTQTVLTPYRYTYKGTCHHVLAMDCEQAQWFVYGGFQKTGDHSSEVVSVTIYTRT